MYLIWRHTIFLYMNKAKEEKAFSSNAAAGGKCYQVLKSVILPAHFVQTGYIPIKVMAGNLQTPVTGRHYFLKDRLIEWQGRLARLEIAFDVTNYEKERTSFAMR